MGSKKFQVGSAKKLPPRLWIGKRQNPSENDSKYTIPILEANIFQKTYQVDQNLCSSLVFIDGNVDFEISSARQDETTTITEKIKENYCSTCDIDAAGTTKMNFPFCHFHRRKFFRFKFYGQHFKVTTPSSKRKCTIYREMTTLICSYFFGYFSQPPMVFLKNHSWYIFAYTLNSLANSEIIRLLRRTNLRAKGTFNCDILSIFAMLFCFKSRKIKERPKTR